MTDFLKCILAATFLLTLAACQTDKIEQDFLIAPGEVWSLERDGWPGLKLDEQTRTDVESFWGGAERLHYRYEDSTFWMSDEGKRLEDVLYRIQNEETSNTSFNNKSLTSRHFSEVSQTTLNKHIDIIYICLPDRSDPAQRSSSGLNNLGLTPGEEFDMYEEFSAAVDDWSLPRHILYR